MKMKIQSLYKLIGVLIICLLVGIQTAYAAGTIAKIWTNPAAFTPNEEVTIYFDVSGTDLAGNAGPLYLWTWMPNDPVDGNGAWDNSADHMVCQKVEGDVWSFTMTPATFYGTSDMTKIEGLLKTKDGGSQTDNFDETNGNAIFLYDFSRMSSKIIATVPSLFKMNEPMSIILNVANAYSDGGSSQGQLIGKQPALHSGVNGWSNVVDAGSEKTLLKEVTGVDGVTNVWKIDLIPSEYWGTNPSEALKAINCLFNDNGSWDASGRDVAGENFELVPIDPNATVQVEYRFFPSKFTLNDVVSFYFDQMVTEVEGLKDAGEIFYSVFADGGSTAVIEGKMKAVGNGQFMAIMIPALVLPSGVDPSSLTVVFQTADGSAQSAPMEITSIVK